MFAPSQADITEARLTRWGRNPTKQEKEEAREAINAYVKTKVEAGAVRDRVDVLPRCGRPDSTSTVRARITFPSKTPTAGERYD